MYTKHKNFIDKLKEKNKDFDYDYTDTDYGARLDKITVKCNIHGNFTKSVQQLERGKGCPTCIETRKKTQALLDFVEKAKVVHNNKYVYSNIQDYKNSKTPVTITCPIHGDFEQTPDNHLAGHGCKKCQYESVANKNRKSLEEFIDKATCVHDGFYDYSTTVYNSSKEKVKIICPTHGEFLQLPSHHLKGCGCPKCSVEKASNRLMWSTEDFITKAVEVHGNTYDYSLVDYKGSSNKVKIVLPNGQVVEQLATHHISGYRPAEDERGLDYNRPAILYYLKITTTDSTYYKIGITTKTVEQRFTPSELLLIQTVFTIKFSTAKEAFNVEQDLIKQFKPFLYKGENILKSGNTELFICDIFNGGYNEIIAMGKL
jgi:hypothetical protein